MNFTLSISAFGPSITEQCNAAGVESTGMPMELVERVSKAITLCLFQGVLTESECDKARKRLIKYAKFQEVATQQAEGAKNGAEGGEQ